MTVKSVLFTFIWLGYDEVYSWFYQYFDLCVQLKKKVSNDQEQDFNFLFFFLHIAKLCKKNCYHCIQGRKKYKNKLFWNVTFVYTSASFALWDTFRKWKQKGQLSQLLEMKKCFFSKLCTENKQLHSWLPLFTPWLSSAGRQERAD